MRSSGVNFNYFTLIELANLVHFKRMLMFCLEDWGDWAPLSTPLVLLLRTVKYRGRRRPRLRTMSANSALL